jgi:DNA-binding transcriptional MerR regulator
MQGDPAEHSPPPPRTAAQTVAEIASSVAAEPKFAAPVSTAAGFDEIYHAAEIVPPAHGYSIMKIAEMLQSERIRTLPSEVKKNSILLALDAAGVKIEEVIEDAVKRDRALDGFERVQQKTLDEMEARRTQENQQIQAELDRLVQEHKARMQANNDAVAKEKERFYGWRLQKQQEEQKIADSVSYFVSENPITTGGVAVTPRGAQAAEKPPAPK